MTVEAQTAARGNLVAVDDGFGEGIGILVGPGGRNEADIAAQDAVRPLSSCARRTSNHQTTVPLLTGSASMSSPGKHF